MTDALKTYTVSIPSVAFAQMALRLAHKRYYGMPCDDWALQERDWYIENGVVVGASGEYYRIIDRLSRGEKP